MSDDDGVSSRPASPAPQLSKRHFIYGATATAAGAVLLRRGHGPGGSRAGRGSRLRITAGAAWFR